MASEVDICNLALSHLGDSATIASLEPPEGSAQAEHCARFYPIARDSLLEMHSWAFATKRAQLAPLTNPWPQWSYAYAPPADFLRALAVIPRDATDDFTAVAGLTDNLLARSDALGIPRPYTIETSSTGAKIVLTDLEEAALRYVARVTDTTKFSPLFVMTLSWHLASMLAGPVIKGDMGAAEAKRCAQMMTMWLSQARTSDASQHKSNPVHTPGWIAGR